MKRVLRNYSYTRCRDCWYWLWRHHYLKTMNAEPEKVYNVLNNN